MVSPARRAEVIRALRKIRHVSKLGELVEWVTGPGDPKDCLLTWRLLVAPKVITHLICIAI